MNNINLYNNFKNESAVIIGGSLSGLMTGIALAREGLFVTILEKSSKDRHGGGGLQVDGGLFDSSKTARFLRKMVSGGKTSVQLWSTLESRLRTEANSHFRIDLRFDTRVQIIDQNEDSAWAVTENGETIHGDILIGADGHRSMVRRHVAPDHPDATFAGYIVWIASVDENDIPEVLRPDKNAPRVTMLNSLNGFLFGSVIKDENFPGTGNRRIGCTWYDNSQNNLLRRLGCLDGSVVHHSLEGSDIPEENLIELAEAAERIPEPWLSVMLQAIQTRNLTGIPIKEYVPDKLAKGRIALVGDAAHVPAPITASGFNESLQDAAELGKCVAKGIQGDAAIIALEKYESLRLNKVRQMVQSGQSFSWSFGRS